MNTLEKMALVEKIAKEEFDGHYTLMRFTTDWRFTFGTVNNREDVYLSVKGKTIDEVLDKAIETKRSVYDGQSTTLADIMDKIGKFDKQEDWKQLT